MAVSAKRFDYRIALAADGTLSAEGQAPLRPEEAWTPDHLLLAALVRCTVQSLQFHATRAAISVDARADAEGTVTKRDDGRYAFVEIRCEIDVELEPEPGADDLKELLFKAERDCFVGASLTVKPEYRWRINGTDVALGDADVTSREEPSSAPGP